MANSIVFSFHNVSNNFNLGFNNIGKVKFDGILSYLENTYQNPLICFDDGYLDVYHNTMSVSNNINKVIFPITDYLGKMNSWDINFILNRKKHMSSYNILDMHSRGWQIGSHGHSHISYSKLDDKEIKEDLSISKNILEDLVGEEITIFTPPFGYIDQKQLRIVSEVGYKTIFLNNCYIKDIEDECGLEVVERVNIYSIDTIKSITKKSSNSMFYKNLENIIHKCSKLTVFFKR